MTVSQVDCTVTLTWHISAWDVLGNLSTYDWLAIPCLAEDKVQFIIPGQHYISLLCSSVHGYEIYERDRAINNGLSRWDAYRVFWRWVSGAWTEVVWTFKSDGINSNYLYEISVASFCAKDFPFILWKLRFLQFFVEFEQFEVSTTTLVCEPDVNEELLCPFLILRFEQVDLLWVKVFYSHVSVPHKRKPIRGSHHKVCNACGNVKYFPLFAKPCLFQKTHFIINYYY